LLVLVLAVLLLCWIGLSAAAQYGLVVQLIYPASLGVALVLLFDKATRTWGTKGGAERTARMAVVRPPDISARPGFLNLRSVAKPEAYAGSFWDILNVVLFFAAFWLVDRSAARSRFLVGLRLPGRPAAVAFDLGFRAGRCGSRFVVGLDVAFPHSGGVFFILEVVTLISSTGERQTLPAVKDALFVVIYAILLIVAANPMREVLIRAGVSPKPLAVLDVACSS
jgi:hypothetical protein